MSETAATQGVHHIGFTVPDLDRTRAFFIGTLEFTQIGEVPDYPAVFLTDGTTTITLWQAETPAAAVPFDRRNVIGLHHFALRVADTDALETIHTRLRGCDDVEIEFAPEYLAGGPSKHLMCSIPGGIRMELIASGG